MDDYIRREDVLKLEKTIHLDSIGYSHRSIDPTEVKIIKSADVRPEVRGKWIKHDKYLQYCSICMYMVRGSASEEAIKEFKYCPNCGAENWGEKDGE